jgi:predicted RNA-binding Zn-ribbon protein involved in translation (DUF1610 family)
MKVIKRYNQHRRDLSIDTECENCGAKDTDKTAYDDSDFWNIWQPKQKCPKCGESTESLNIEPEDTHTKYPEGLQV